MDNEYNVDRLHWVSRMLIVLAIFFVLLSMVPLLLNPGRFFELLKLHKENASDVMDSFYGEVEESGAKKKKGFENLLAWINNEYNNETLQEPGYDEKEVFCRVWASYLNEHFDHYFKYLFLLVRFVVTKNFLTYEQKRNYLRIVRALLSTHEQILIYYNWLSGAGQKWEDKTNKFLTDYRVIHNINPGLVIKDFTIETTSPFKELLENGDYMCETGRTDDTLFDFQSRHRGG